MESRNYDGSAKIAELERNCEYAQRVIPGNLAGLSPAMNESNGSEQPINIATYSPVKWLSDLNQNLIFFPVDDDTNEVSIHATMAAKQGKQIFDNEVFVEGTLKRVIGFGLKV